MKYRSLEDQICDVESVNYKVAHHIVSGEKKEGLLTGHSFSFFDDLIVCFDEFFFQSITDILMKSEFFGVIIEIENAAYVISLSLKRIGLDPEIVVQLVQNLGNQES